MNGGDQELRAISLRHLKAFARAVEQQSISRAAETLDRSQTAITKAIADLERQLAVKLFDRQARGVLPTPAGMVLARRAATVAAEFDKARTAYLGYLGAAGNRDANPVFSMDISLRRLLAFLAFYDHGDTDSAARSLGCSASAIHGSVREIERHLGLALFERTPLGIRAHEYACVLATHIRLVCAEIRHAIDELASRDGVVRGRVAIGTLPFMRSIIIPRAINQLLVRQPQLRISTRDGPYEMLERALKSGEIDLIVGAVRRGEPAADLEVEPLFDARLSVIGRVGHPLVGRASLSIADLYGQRWVLPPATTPSRQIFDQVLGGLVGDAGADIIETSSLAMVRGLLMESDRLALLSEHQIHYEKCFGMLAVLPIALDQTYRAIGVTMRAHATLSPAARLFLAELRGVAQAVIPEGL